MSTIKPHAYFLILTFAFVPNVLAQPTSERTPVVLYDFAEAKGNVVRDRSGFGKPLDLIIENPKAVTWKDGSLQIHQSTIVRSKSGAAKLSQAIRRSRAISIEAWVTPKSKNQKGPARIVSLSKNSVLRNVTLGQEGDKYDVRLRTTKASENGLPSLSTSSGAVNTRLTHVVYTRSPSGIARCFVNGRQIADSSVQGDMTNWREEFPLALGNELTNDRPWLGTFHLVAIYSHDLDAREIAAHFKAGKDRRFAPSFAKDAGNELFETKIAALLSDRCLECHDAVNRKGGLDLSRRSFAFAGGDSGKVIAPGDMKASLLWRLVESNEMPHDRDPLSAEEKELVGRWIQSGAKWTLSKIDPAIYAFGSDRNAVFVQRLTVPEYIATVKATLGVDVSKEAPEILPRDLRADGFSNTSYNLNVDFGHVDAYSKLAEIIVNKMDVAKFAARFSKSKRLTDDDARKLIRKMGGWVLRGPIEEHELALFRGVTTTVMAAGGSFEDAVGYIIQAMLQSPRFLYRMESQVGDGSSWPIGEYELASRFSYIIWGASPDEELLQAAEKGELGEKAEFHIDRMLRDPRTVDRSVQFAIDWLDLNRLQNLRPNKEHFPKWNSQLAEDMREETIAFFKHVVWKKGQPLSALLNAQVSFMSPKLAEHYGIRPRGEAPGWYDLSKIDSRGGLLTQGSVLTVGGDEASMVSRGLFVMQDLLRGVVKDPPPCVDTTPVATRAGLTQRSIAETRIADSNCGGCHSKFEPLAFGLETYDGLGTFRLKDSHGNRMRSDGEILFPGAEKAVSYEHSAQLMDLLAGSGRVKESITWKLTQFSTGRPLSAADARQVADIHKSAMVDGGTYRSLLKSILGSDLVRKTRTVVADDE